MSACAILPWIALALGAASLAWHVATTASGYLARRAARRDRADFVAARWSRSVETLRRLGEQELRQAEQGAPPAIAASSLLRVRPVSDRAVALIGVVLVAAAYLEPALVERWRGRR